MGSNPTVLTVYLYQRSIFNLNIYKNFSLVKNSFNWVSSSGEICFFDLISSKNVGILFLKAPLMNVQTFEIWETVTRSK